MRFVTFLSFGALLAFAACGNSDGADSGGDADADTDADTDTDTGDTGTTEGSPVAAFTVNLYYGVDVNGEVVGVTLPVNPTTATGTATTIAQPPTLQLVETDSSGAAVCVTNYTINTSNVTNWAAGDYFSWETAAGDLTVNAGEDGCAEFATGTTSYGTFILANAFKFSIGPLDPSISVTDTEIVPYVLGGQFTGTYLPPAAPFFATYAFAVDENMNVLSDDGGATLNQVLAADVPSGASVVSAYYVQFGLSGFYQP
jgi:hypothetical protein